MSIRATICFLTVGSLSAFQAFGYNLENNPAQKIISRRDAFKNVRKWALPVLTSTAATYSATSNCLSFSIANAKETTAASIENEIRTLQDATEALSSLLENWDRATIDCTYADVPRDLLEAKNKDKLLEKASEFALFDKSTSVVSCKRTNRIVRDYIGATGKGPLVGAEKRLLKKGAVERVDPESLDDYISAVESFSQSISKANSLSYTAGSADFDSVNNFAKGNESKSGDGSNLEQSRRAIAEANLSLQKAVSLLMLEDP